MQSAINLILKLLKWPLAILMLVMFVPVFKADAVLVKSTFNASFVMHFIAPMVGMIAIWFVVPGLNGSHLAIFEHEFTHMLAALLTFHMPKSMKIEADKGGSFGYYGAGNWFITLAPYFVPTFPLLMMIGSLLFGCFDMKIPEFYIPSLGMMFGYHLISNAMQIHGEQTDFSKAGWIFSVLFLPTANLISFGFVWAFAAKNWAGVASWWNLLLHQTEKVIEQLF